MVIRHKLFKTRKFYWGNSKWSKNRPWKFPWKWFSELSTPVLYSRFRKNQQSESRSFLSNFLWNLLSSKLQFLLTLRFLWSFVWGLRRANIGVGLEWWRGRGKYEKIWWFRLSSIKKYMFHPQPESRKRREKSRKWILNQKYWLSQKSLHFSWQSWLTFKILETFIAFGFKYTFNSFIHCQFWIWKNCW